MLKDLKISVPNVNERDQIPAEAIQAVVDYVVQSFEPEQVILFGSYAAGQPQPGSDVDLLVILDADDPRQTQREMALSFQAPFGLDILVRTPREITDRVRAGDSFLRNIVANGKILYEKTGYALLQDIDMTEPDAKSNRYIQEWVQKAEGDFLAATSLLNLQREGMADAICFHTQQCAEKYVKAYLTHHRVEFQRTHDLVELLRLCRQIDAEFSKISAAMQALNSYSVETRYPGRFASLEEATGAVEVMTTVRDFVRTRLELED
ncbi:MAG: HEPN domain-containing protein [Anaerolineae bacterium]|nr:HEPN domain-containing protein [Anaerolineae bacterium]